MYKLKLRFVSVIVLISLFSILPFFSSGGSNVYALAKNTGLSHAPASFVGEAAGDNSGFCIASAGDVNGDGYEDILIGAKNAKYAGKNAVGKVYLLLGSAAGWTNDINSNNFNLAKAAACFIGENADDKAGYSVASAGDVNGDGLDDILIGAYGNDQGGTDSGQVYLILGQVNINWGMFFNLANANASFVGEAADDQAGYSVASAGDVNNDSYGDFMIGAPGNAGNQGKTYLIKGRADVDWGTRYSLSKAENSFRGAPGSKSGSAVTSAGDVNKDGYSDFLIGAPYDTNLQGANSGQVYLIRGKQIANWGKDFNLSNADGSFIGEAIGDEAGTCVASAGDVNGDTLGDFLIGAPRNSEGGANSGQVYVIFGKAGNWGMQFSLANSDATFIGEKSNDYSGISLSGGYDTNGDGFKDILIGAYTNDDGGNDAGKVYLIQGKSSGWIRNTALSTADATFTGENANDGAGRSVAFIGDTNKNGGIYFIIGAYGVDWSAAESGKTYLFFGNNAPNVPVLPACEGQANAIRVNTLTPELSWSFSDNNKSDTQKAYQILVASTSAKLLANDGDLWNTNKISESVNKVVYAGKVLQWGTKYYWKVRNWDNNDMQGSYSTEQSFTLQSMPNAPSSPKCEGADNPSDLNDITPDFTWVFSDPDDGDTQSAFQIIVASKVDNLISNTGDLWDSGKVESKANYTVYAGAELSQGKTYFWKVKTWDSAGCEGSYSEQRTFLMRSNSLPVWAIVLIASLGAFFVGGAIALIVNSKR